MILTCGKTSEIDSGDVFLNKSIISFKNGFTFFPSIILLKLMGGVFIIWR